MYEYIIAAIVLLVIAVGVIIYLVVRPTPSKNEPTPSNEFDSSMADDLLAQMSAAVAVKDPSVKVASAAIIDDGNKLKTINTYADRITKLYNAAKISGENLQEATIAYNHANKLAGDANNYMALLRGKFKTAFKARSAIA